MTESLPVLQGQLNFCLAGSDVSLPAPLIFSRLNQAVLYAMRVLLNIFYDDRMVKGQTEVVDGIRVHVCRLMCH